VDGGACGEECRGRGYEAVALLRGRNKVTK
jgi:hypothetical protein